MSNFRWAVIAAISAVFISVFLGVISGVNILHIFLRAIIFGAVFFGFGFGLRFVVNSFFPELLFHEDESITQDIDQSGSRVNITLDSSGEYAVPELYKTSDDSQEMGNIEDLISGVFRPRGSDDYQRDEKQVFAPIMADEGIDGSRDAGYNEEGGLQDFQDLSVFERPSQAEKPAVDQATQFTPSFGDDSGLGGLPDLDMMARAFSSAYGSFPASAPAPEPVGKAASVPSTPSISPMTSVEEVEPEPVRYAAGNKPQPLEGDFDAKSLAEGIRTVLSKD